MTSISQGLLEPISHIAPIPNVTKDVAFEQKDPEIKVFLSNNLLRSFPVDLFNVEHLTVLSLRHNRLTTLPPSIGKLKNLNTLNIAQNSIRFLPAELLTLFQKGGKLQSFQFQPNPFWAPATTTSNNVGADEYETRTFSPHPNPKIEYPWIGLTTRLLSRTPVQFIDSSQKPYTRFALPPIRGLSVPATRVPPLEIEPFSQLATPKVLHREVADDMSKVVNPKGAKSLFELALRACAQSGQADWIAAELRRDGEGECWPAHLADAVERVVEIERDGGVECAVCGRETSMPLVRWVEFRQIGRTQVVVDAAAAAGGGGGGNEECRFMGLGGVSEGPVPFMRVGCSWSCVPARTEELHGDTSGEDAPEPERTTVFW